MLPAVTVGFAQYIAGLRRVIDMARVLIPVPRPLGRAAHRGRHIWLTHFKRQLNNNETVHSNSDGTTGFHRNLIFFSNNYGKSCIPILYHQLPFLLSSRFPGKMNWTGAQLDLTSLSSVLEV